MKTKSLLALLLAWAIGVHAQLILNQGESHVLYFNHLGNRVNLFGLPREAHYAVRFSSFELGSAVRCDIWENEKIGEPIYSGWITNGNYEITPVPNIWDDLEGTFCLTVLTGAVTISMLSIDVYAERDANSTGAEAIYSSEFYLEARPPRLEVLSSSSAIHLTWWTNGSSGFVLESSDQVDSSPWNTITNTSTFFAKRKVVTLSNSTPASVRFFRLRK